MLLTPSLLVEGTSLLTVTALLYGPVRLTPTRPCAINPFTGPLYGHVRLTPSLPIIWPVVLRPLQKGRLATLCKVQMDPSTNKIMADSYPPKSLRGKLRDNKT
ncbi:hypothetical protein FKM82_009283 [Ascaphus truei]